MTINKTYTPDPLIKRPGVLISGMLHDLMASRELAWRIFIRNISVLYRQTVLGVVWAFAGPVLAAVTFIFLRKGGVTGGEPLPIPHTPWVICGAFLWQIFADGLMSPLRVLSEAKPMLIKINFPREALILASAAEVLFNALVRLAIIAVVLVWFRIVPSRELLLLPLPILSLAGLGLTLGLLCAPITMMFKDFEKALPLLLPFLMILSGAVVRISHEGLVGKLAALNPVFPALDTARSWLTGQPAAHLPAMLAIAAATAGLTLFGWVLYRVAMPHIIARVGN